MYCNSCGKQNPDGSAFCMACGRRMPAFTPTAAPAPAPVQVAPPPTPRPIRSSTPSSQADRAARAKQVRAEFNKVFHRSWRDMITSPLMLVFIILCSISSLIGLYNALDPMSLLGDLQYELRQFGIYSSDLENIGFFLLLLQVPTVLILVGMWIQYAEGHSNSGAGPINTTGLSLVKGGCIANVAMGGLAVVILMFSACSVLDSSYGSALFLGFLIGGGFAVFYYYLLLSVVSNAKDAAETAYPNSDKITVLAVFQFISGGVSFLTIFSEGGINWSVLLSSGISILSGVVLLQLKDSMEDLVLTRSRMEREAKRAAEAPAPRPNYQQQPTWARVSSQSAPVAPQPVPVAPQPVPITPQPVVVAEEPAAPAPVEQPAEPAPAPVEQPAPVAVEEKAAVAVCSCGTENTGGWAFCPRCGKPFANS